MCLTLRQASSETRIKLSKQKPLNTRRIHNQRKSDLTKRHQKLASKKNRPHPHTGRASMAQKNNNKTKPPNTLLSSQTTPLRPRNKPRGYWPLTRLRTTRAPPKWSFPLGHRRTLRPGRVATTCPSYATGNVESNNLLGGMSRLAQDQLTRSTPAIFRLPRRSTSQRPCRKSVGWGTQSSSSILVLLTETPPSAIVRRAAPLLCDSPLATSRSTIPSGEPGFNSATEVSRRAAVSVDSSNRLSSPRPNRAWLACSTDSVACSPCTSVVSSRASRRCAVRSCGREAVVCSSSASSSADRKVNQRRYRMTSASAALTKY